MSKLFAPLRFRNLIIIILFLFAALLVIKGFSTNSSSITAKASNQVEIRISSKTQALQVISKQNISDRFFNLSVKNSSDKPITAFVMSFGRNKVTEEFIHDEGKFISPGNVYTKTYPLPTGTPAPEFIIQAVVFDDGTGEGNINDIRAITETRLGQALQYKRFLSALKEVESTSEFQLPLAWNKLKERVSSLPDGKSEQLPVNVRYGLHNGKQDLIDEIKSLDLTQVSSNEIRLIVEELKARYTKMVPRYNPDRNGLTPLRDM